MARNPDRCSRRGFGLQDLTGGRGWESRARNGARGGEVFHSLRGDGIDDMRRQEVDNRARRLQAGHELGDEHDKYGFRALNREDCQRLANLPLEPEIDWSVFKGLDFDALARGRRSRGRRPKMMED